MNFKLPASLNGTPFRPSSLGEALKANVSPSDPLELIFEESLATGKLPAIINFSMMHSWLYACFFDVKISIKTDLLMKSLMELLISLTPLASTLELVVVRALLKRLICKLKYSLPSTSPVLARLIYAAHAPKSLIPRNAFDEAQRLLDLLSHNNRLLLFWPLAAMINIVKEAPQPSSCTKLLEIATCQNFLDDPLLRSLCGSAILIALDF